MVQLNVAQRVFVVRTYFETRSYVEVKHSLMVGFPEREPPDNKTIWRNVEKYSHHGTNLNMNKLWLYKFCCVAKLKGFLINFVGYFFCFC